MIGIVVELLISWLLLKFIAKENLSALGLMPTKKRGVEFIGGLLWPVFYFCVFEYTVSLLVQNPYRLNPAYHMPNFLMAIGYLFRSVAFEDLIFRGALLFILIQKVGPQKALLISAVAFGIYHWVSWSVLGNPVQMIIVFLTTGAAGYVFALAFVKTCSMYLPFALHFGCDFASMVLFSHDKGMGSQLLIKTFQHDPTSPGSVVSLIVIVISFMGFPVASWLVLKRIKFQPSVIYPPPH